LETETSTKRSLTITAQDLSIITGELNKSAGRAKITGHIYLFLTFAIGVWILLLFAYNNELNTISLSYAKFTIADQSGVGRLKEILDEINKTAGTDDNIKKELLSALSKRLDPQLGNESQLQQIAPVLSATVVRIGSVLVGIFLIQIMVGFARYYYRLAEHLRICSTALKLSGGLTADLKLLVPLMMPNIEFGKIPNSPIEKLSDTAMKTIGEVAKKIPGR
jgi:hypothetical protein